MVFGRNRTAHYTEARWMDQLIPGLAALVESFRDSFHPRVFSTFQTLVAGWAVCTGPRTISEVWQGAGLAARRHHDTAYAVFHRVAWEWDDQGIIGCPPKVGPPEMEVPRSTWTGRDP